MKTVHFHFLKRTKTPISSERLSRIGKRVALPLETEFGGFFFQ